MYKEVRLYVPSCEQTGERLAGVQVEVAVTRVVRAFSRWYGGATTTTGNGLYVGDDERVHSEPVTIVASYAKDVVVDKHRGELVYLAECIRNEANQECVLVTIRPVDEVLFI